MKISDNVKKEMRFNEARMPQMSYEKVEKIVSSTCKDLRWSK